MKLRVLAGCFCLIAGGVTARAAAPAALPAFPGAEGGGALSRGGRGGRVIYVTSLNDAGSGSLRSAVAEKGPRTVLFAVAGTIELASVLEVKEPFLTIAGQSAPGGGVCLKNFNPASPADGARDADDDGYTNLEEFLNGTPPRS